MGDDGRIGHPTLLFSFGLSPPGTGTFALADKVGHGAMYLATSSCFLLASVWRPGRGDGSFPTSAPLFAIGVLIAGIVIEVLQEVATDGHGPHVDAALLEPHRLTVSPPCENPSGTAAPRTDLRGRSPADRW